jgi:hypothetical protein
MTTGHSYWSFKALSTPCQFDVRRTVWSSKLLQGRVSNMSKARLLPSPLSAQSLPGRLCINPSLACQSCAGSNRDVTSFRLSGDGPSLGELGSNNSFGVSSAHCQEYGFRHKSFRRCSVWFLTHQIHCRLDLLSVLDTVSGPDVAWWANRTRSLRKDARHFGTSPVQQHDIVQFGLVYVLRSAPSLAVSIPYRLRCRLADCLP